MAGRTPHEAVINYVAPIQRAVACVTRGQVRVSQGGYSQGPEHALALNRGEPMTLSGPSKVSLTIKQRYRIVEAEGERGPYKVSISWYVYTIAEEAHEIIGYHWHPDGHHIPWPHLHLEAGAGEVRAELQKAHVPTGRVAVEDVIRLLVTCFGVPPVKEHRDDWDAVLEENQQRFERWRTWGGSRHRERPGG